MKRLTTCGSYPRNSMMVGTYRIAGEDALRSQFVIVVVSTPMRSATCFWRRLRFSRRLRMWSPNVLIA
jgi:hypothetical protein